MGLSFMFVERNVPIFVGYQIIKEVFIRLDICIS